jgi:hypothetical protein
MNLDMYIKFDMTDLEGNLIKPGTFTKCHSLVQAFAAWIAGYVNGNVAVALVPDTSNINRTLPSPSLGYGWWGGTGGVPAIGVTTHGILAGTGTTAPAITNYGMQTLITHGTGAGQLSYAAQIMNTTLWTVSGSDSYCENARTLTNSTADTITIREVGYVVNMTGTTGRFLIDRTAVNQAVLASTAVVITYRFKITV